MQEELQRLQEVGSLLESLETNLELWLERLQDEARTADQVRRHVELIQSGHVLFFQLVGIQQVCYMFVIEIRL